MSFSKEWNDVYKRGNQLSIWPWSDLVSFVNRYAHPELGFNTILELGCGAGANIPFFLSLGEQIDYYAIEGSEFAVNMLKESYPQLKTKLFTGDFCESIPIDIDFDLIIDRSSMVHNTTEKISDALALLSKKLRFGGKFIGIDWFSTEHSEFTNGSRIDSYTRGNFDVNSHFSNVGNVHFFDEKHLLNLFNSNGFTVDVLEKKNKSTYIPNNSIKSVWWNFVASKN